MLMAIHCRPSFNKRTQERGSLGEDDMIEQRKRKVLLIKSEDITAKQKSENAIEEWQGLTQRNTANRGR